MPRSASAANFFNALDGTTMIDVADDTTVLYDDIAFGDVSDNHIFDYANDYTLFVDMDNDGEADFQFAMPTSFNSGDLYHGEQGTGYVYADGDGNPKVLYVSYSAASALTSTTTFKGIHSTIAILGSPDFTIALDAGPYSIPDDDPGYLDIPVDVAAYMATNSITCAEVDYVSFTFTDLHHTWPSDITFYLSSPTTSDVEVGYGTGSVEATQSGDSGALGDWSGEDPAVTWTITAEDIASPDSGTVASMTLNFWCK